MGIIAGKTVIITGASSGIGEATAIRLAESGAAVALAARRTDRLDTLVAAIESRGGKAMAVATDVTRRADLDALVTHAVARFGTVDVLVNNAGIMPLSRLDLLDVDGWDRTIDTNIKGVLYAIAAVLPGMKAQRSGHIISISSVAGHRINGGSAVYAATKHAVRVISEALRQEVTADGIRTTIISPGATQTELFDKLTDPAAQRRLASAAEIALPADTVARAIAYAIGEPAEVDINEILIRPQAQES
ncbi:SDR family oxidoreductase [Sphingomonas sp.]|uniref:SDR family oxidoreductase n=1 Tax=Sphingomonas sp. TaxID=28214 RepID=UPI003D6D5843